MYYINKVLFLTKDDIPTPTDSTLTTEYDTSTTTEFPAEVESVPSEIVEDSGTLSDSFIGDLDTPSTSESNDLMDAGETASLLNVVPSTTKPQNQSYEKPLR